MSFEEEFPSLTEGGREVVERHLKQECGESNIEELNKDLRRLHRETELVNLKVFYDYEVARNCLDKERVREVIDKCTDDSGYTDICELRSELGL